MICSRSPQVEYIPGGATQNTIRIAQSLLQKSHPNSCAFVGCVGKDSYAEQMRKACGEAGFTPLYLEVCWFACALECRWVGQALYYKRGFYDDLNILSTLPECIMSIISKASENPCVCVCVLFAVGLGRFQDGEWLVVCVDGFVLVITSRCCAGRDGADGHVRGVGEGQGAQPVRELGRREQLQANALGERGGAGCGESGAGVLHLGFLHDGVDSVHHERGQALLREQQGGAWLV